MAEPLPQHQLSIGYLLLWLGAWLMRLPAMIGMRIKERKDIQTLTTSNVSRTRIQIPSRQKERTIKVDVYEKKGQSKEKRRFVHVNFHGSGFVIPSLGSDVEFCTQLALTGTVVLDADYRKAPEHPFPAAVHDADDVLLYVQNHASDFDTEHVTIGGFSAGANLAMSAAVNSSPGSIAGLVSIYGNTDMTKVYPAPDKDFDSGMVLPEWLRAFFYRCLILPEQDRSDPRLSPAYASFDRWPKHCFFACGSADSLHDSAKVMVQRMKDAGHGDVEFLSAEKEAHGFDKGVKQGSRTEEKTKRVYQRSIEMIQRAHR